MGGNWVDVGSGQGPPLPGLLPTSTLCCWLPIPQLSALAWDERITDFGLQLPDETCVGAAFTLWCLLAQEFLSCPWDCWLSPPQDTDSLCYQVNLDRHSW